MFLHLTDIAKDNPMKFKHPAPDELQLGSRRTTRTFLYLPRTIGTETRWLEMASILQECKLGPDPMFPSINSLCWVDLAWADSTSTR